MAELRVHKNDLPILAEVLGIPDQFILDRRTVVGGMEALCMLLKRLTYPCRYSDMMHRFGQQPLSVLCLATNRVVDVLNPPALQTYADCIHQHGVPLNNCFVFIDGTVRPIARPGTNPPILYNGHKRVHSLNFKAVAIPNGVIAHLYGPVGKNLIYSLVKM